MAFQHYPSMIKQLNVGKAVYNGLLAVFLAREGFTGPVNVIENPEGFGRAYTDELKLEELTRGGNDEYRILEVGYKPHAACRWAHGPIDAVIDIMQRAGIAATDIKRIDVYAATLAVRQTSEQQPKTVMDARAFSTPYGMAVAVISGHPRVSVHDFDVAWKNPAVMNLSKKIFLQEDPSFGAASQGCRVEVLTHSGERHAARVDLPKGEPSNPISSEELRAKWHVLADPIIGAEKASEIAGMVDECETLGSIDDLVAIF